MISYDDSSMLFICFLNLKKVFGIPYSSLLFTDEESSIINISFSLQFVVIPNIVLFKQFENIV